MQATVSLMKVSHPTRADLENGYCVLSNGRPFKFTSDITKCSLVRLDNKLMPYYGVKGKPANIIVQDADVVDAAYQSTYAGNTCILNFASGYTPGGAWLRNHGAQEEWLTARSTLFASIGGTFANDNFYSVCRNGNYPFGLDATLLSPVVYLYKKVTGEVVLPRMVGVYSCAAVDYREKYHPDKSLDREQGNAIMQYRIVSLLDSMAKMGYKQIHLGAWGCGVFKNDSSDIAKAFYFALNALGYKYAFDAVYFDIKCTRNDKNFLAFKQVFDKK